MTYRYGPLDSPAESRKSLENSPRSTYRHEMRKCSKKAQSKLPKLHGGNMYLTPVYILFQEVKELIETKSQKKMTTYFGHQKLVWSVFLHFYK